MIAAALGTLVMRVRRSPMLGRLRRELELWRWRREYARSQAEARPAAAPLAGPVLPADDWPVSPAPGSAGYESTAAPAGPQLDLFADRS